VTAPLLHVLAGPNGAGKSTFYERFVEPALGMPFINADVIAAELWPDGPERHAYDAAAEATRRRDAALADRRSFVTETVLSHTSKLELLRRARSVGYQVWLTFIGIDSPDLSAARVAQRVRSGGHSVPMDKLRRRWPRTMAHLPKALAIAHKGWVLDNSGDRPYRLLIRVEGGRIVHAAAPLPAWAQSVLGVLPQVR
jgi:predicted ABC-type ATPase